MCTNNVQVVVMSVRGRSVVRYRDSVTGRFCAKPEVVIAPVTAPVVRELYSENKIAFAVFVVLSTLAIVLGVPEVSFGGQLLTVVGIWLGSMFSMPLTDMINERISASNRQARDLYLAAV